MRPFLFTTLIAILCTAGCVTTPRRAEPLPDEITWTPRGAIESDDDPNDDPAELPEGARMFTSLESDFIEFTGAPVPGSASLTDAVVWDPFESDMPPFGVGGGEISASVDSVPYTVTGGDAFVVEYTDSTGLEYLVLSIFSETDIGGDWFQTNVAVFVLKSDFVPGGTVALDGIDRIAIFAAGPSSAPAPSIFAAAITGTVAFGPTGSATTGDRLSAVVAADFAPAVPVGPPTAIPGVPLAAGDYDLAIDPVADVLCGGTLAGSEGGFGGVTLAPIAVTDGVVALAMPSIDQLTIDGPAIGTAWGTPALLDAVVEPPDTYIGIADLTGAGPLGTELAGAYVFVESAVETVGLARAAVGLAYVDPVADGGCDVVFQATLTAR